MRVFDFTLLSGYEFSGVDVAQEFRARLFAKNNVNAKFILNKIAARWPAKAVTQFFFS